MITPALPRALSPDEPGAGIPHAGISEGGRRATGVPIRKPRAKEPLGAGEYCKKVKCARTVFNTVENSQDQGSS